MKKSETLPESVLQDLDTTMRSKRERYNTNEDDQTENNDTDDHELYAGCTDGSSTVLDDTLAKQAITTENRFDNNNKDTANSKCCEEISANLLQIIS